jgi:hypothetical protein
VGRPAPPSIPPSRVVLGDGGIFGVEEGKDGYLGGVVRSRVDWAPKSLWDVKIDFGSGFINGGRRLVTFCPGAIFLQAYATAPRPCSQTCTTSQLRQNRSTRPVEWRRLTARCVP